MIHLRKLFLASIVQAYTTFCEGDGHEPTCSRCNKSESEARNRI